MNFYQSVLKTSLLFATTQRLSSPELLEPVFRRKIEDLILEVHDTRKIQMMIFETYRSPARQEQLFRARATQLEKVGVHGYGLAVDLVKDISGEPSWKGDFSFLAPLARKYDLVSGIDWGQPRKRHDFVDAGHIQRIAVADQGKLFAGTWYPDANYSPYGPTLTTA